MKPAFGFYEVWDRYRAAIIATLVAVGLLLLMALKLAMSNRRLQESELRFRTVANFTYDWEYWTGADKQILYMSPSCERVTGYAAQAFIANPELLDDIVLPEDRHLLASHFTENAFHEEALLEFRIVHRDGGIRWIAHGCRAVFGPDGEPLGRRVSNRDITARKKLEIATRQFEAIVQSSNDAIISKTLDGIVTSWNPGAEAIFGYTAREMIGQPMTVLFPADRVEEEKYILGQIARGETVSHFDTVRIRKDGTKIDISVTISPIHDEAGKVVGASKVARDITAHKRMQEELSRYKDHLEQEVQQRTADLVLARDAAEAANRAKSIFLANMSHELRTPLNAILGFSGMMRKDVQLDQKERDNLDIINRSGEHLLTLINDVLEMSKIEAGRVRLGKAPFDLDNLVREVADMMRARAQEKGLRLLVEQSPEFPRYIKGDEVRLRQILINLIGNAIKFTDQGGVTLRLGTRQNSTMHLVMEVEDTGIGIKPEDQQSVFEPFVQLGTVAAQKGTGLGLTLVRQYVLLMGGSISLDSTVGEGSVFRVELPADEAEAAEVFKKEDPGKGDVIGLSAGQPAYRILIVEDQLENQLLLTRLMESVGFEVKVAEHGEQGVQLFREWQPHLIFMDRRMPVMDGIEATKAIRQLPGGKEVKIVAVTASAFMEQRDEMMAAGMDDFVRKPYRFNEIYDCLNRQLGVKYLYANAAPTLPASEVILTPEMLSALPQELRRELRAALESLEVDRIYAVIDQVAARDISLSKTLSNLAGNFDYPAILKFL